MERYIRIEHKKGVDIRKGMFGLFFEDINYAADGGLYAEMLENRAFEFLKASGTNNHYKKEYDGGYAWSAYPAGTLEAVMEYRTEAPVNEKNPHYLHLRTKKAGCGVSNQAYDGILLKAGMKYTVSFYARTGGINTLHVRIEKDGREYENHPVSLQADHTWRKYTLSFVAKEAVRGAVFSLVLEQAGEVELDFVSMLPGDAVYGIFRKDLADLLKELKPGFLRFPGGCVVEGNELSNRYRWKESVGELTGRTANWNRWAVHGNNEKNNYLSRFCHYNQTLGIGYYEYFLLCEYIGAKPLPVLNVGLACQYQSDELVETGTPEFEEYIQDALDLIEFANGGTDTRWGALRAQMGHEEPFHLTLIGIGNEQWETERVDFFHRYTLFEQAIHKVYPEMKLIGSAGPCVGTKEYTAAWEFYRQKEHAEDFAYAVDEHYYMKPEWFLSNTHFYDNYDRHVKVFSGEYAAHVEGKEKEAKSTLGAAIAEAAFLTGVERNADVVLLSCYAPLFARVGYDQWAPDLIWFDDETAYGTPSYYVQKLYAGNTGDYTLLTEGNAEEAGIFHTASYAAETKELLVKLVNTKEEEQEVTLCFHGFELTGEGVQLCLSGEDSEAVNSLTAPTHLAPVRKQAVFAEKTKLSLPPNSLTVYRIAEKKERT